MSTSPGTGGRPEVGTLIADSFRLMRQHADHLLRIGAGPAIMVLVIEIAMSATLTSAPVEPPSGEGGAPASALAARLLHLLAFFLLDTVPMTLFVANWLRVLLLGPAAVHGLGLRWGLRETRFLLRGLLIWLLAGIAVGLPMALLLTLTGDIAGFAPVILAATMFANLYIALRLSFSLVALALDQSLSLAQSWQLTRGVSGRLVAAVVLAALPLLVIALVASLLAEAVGLSAAAPLSMLLFGVVFSLLVSAAGVAALALVYRHVASSPRAGA